MNISQMPGPGWRRMGWTRPSQLLKLPITLHATGVGRPHGEMHAADAAHIPHVRA